MDKLPEKCVDTIFADPPYNLQLKNELYRPNLTKVDGVDDAWDQFSSFKEYDDFSYSWLKACRKVLKDTGTIWVIGSYHNIFRIGKIMMDLGYWILNDIQWYKTNPMPNFRGVRFTNATETIIWAKKSEKQKKYTFNHVAMKAFNDNKQMKSVWQLPLCTGKERLKDENGKKAHSTQKPEEILRRVILACTKQGDTILDPFLGSGTTGAVAKKLNRKSIGIENELSYIKMSHDRIKNINPEDFKHLIIDEPPKKNLQRVSMQEIVEKGYLKPGDKLYAKKKTREATVLENGQIQLNGLQGSIHKIGASLRDAPSCNGWMFWKFQRKDQFLLLDKLREEYREQAGQLFGECKDEKAKWLRIEASKLRAECQTMRTA